jgi:hypothetical protein
MLVPDDKAVSSAFSPLAANDTQGGPSLATSQEKAFGLIAP